MIIDVGRRFVRQGDEGENSEDSETDSEPTDDMDDSPEEELVLEDWVEWIRRSTAVAEQQLEKARITDWVTEQRKRYWDFAGRVARHSDSRWSHVILDWVPHEGFRRVGSPEKRWIDDIATYCSKHLGDSWFLLAQDVKTWETLRDKFLEISSL